VKTESIGRRDPGYRLGVGIMLLNGHGDVLVARRADLRDETWQMPQGGIDDGEDPRDAALRELAEEIGTSNAEIIGESKGWLSYDFPKELIGTAWAGRWRGQMQKWFVMRFTGTDADINLDTKEPEFIEWKWVAVEQLPKLVVSFKRQVYLDLLTEFADLSETVDARLARLLADPIIRMTMAADNVSEEQLYDLLRRACRNLRVEASDGSTA
jgi:putative (di)nucleoside polyphosphate hydrolase